MGSWDVDLQSIIFLVFCWILQRLPRQDGFQPPSCSAFPHAALLMARAHSGAHIFGTKENPSHCPLLPAYSMTLFYSLLHSRSFRPHLMQPLESLQHCCLLMFTLLRDSTAPGSNTVSQHYPWVTLLESPLAQGL